MDNRFSIIIPNLDDILIEVITIINARWKSYGYPTYELLEHNVIPNANSFLLEIIEIANEWVETPYIVIQGPVDDKPF
ncbi:hypothetical protein BKH46_08615 [Helicobacter sp. 12S02634-8]|uniref:hypothetical protein n=1 Tax=Helicobacter sp. 12S02634-8 TaxID=1476199 RepID=UPI000BA62B43|nr:hypothetical protein [Helicobacter sp. 12S02634-8]PAF46189.1 hypothetical protein BKH46_08615 [Helicobacter sp. 12S02634-8]